MHISVEHVGTKWTLAYTMVEFEDLENKHDCTNNPTAGGVHGEADAKSRARAFCCDAWA